jgi:NADH dehydrogenase
MGQTLFLTGASGYVGNRLLDQLDSSQFTRIVCLVRHRDSIPAEIVDRDGVDLVVGDLLAAETYSAGLEGCDTVIHLAAVTGKAQPSAYFNVNAEGTRQLLEVAARAGVRSFLHISTIAVKFTDQTRYFYAHSKALAEQLVRESGLAHTILRPTIVIGRGSPVLLGLAKMAGAPVMPVFGNGKTPVQPVFVDDLVTTIRAILVEERFEGETIEIGGSETMSIEEFLIRIRRTMFGKSPRSLHLPLRPVRALLSVLERFLLPILPLTAGQLALFANESSIEPSFFLDQHNDGFLTVDRVLEMVASDG